MPRAYSYLRFSTPEQLKGDSLRRQVERSKEWADRHGYFLDDSLDLRDLGVSGFKGKNRTEGRLKAFVDAVAEGKVEPGSVLLVENLDRLSRDEVLIALRLFLELLERDIVIVTIEPPYEFRRDDLDQMKLMYAIMEMGRSHGESLRKSDLLSRAWEQKRKTISETKLTARSHAWLTLSEDRKSFALVPDAVATVRMIYDWACEGHGLRAILKRLSDEDIPAIGRSKTWQRSYISKILHDRAVLGEYQPHTGHGSRERKPIGEPIPGYYPAIIDEDTWHRAQRALRDRRGKPGRQGVGVTNLFSGLLRNARDGHSMVVVNKGKRGTRGPVLVSNAALNKLKGADTTSFPLNHLEDAILRTTNEITAEDLLPTAEKSGLHVQVAETEASLADRDERISQAKERLLTDPDFASLADVLKRLESDRQLIAERLERLRGELAASREGRLDECKSVIQLLAEAPEGERQRLRLRAKAMLAELYEDIWVYVRVKGLERTAFIQCNLKTGGVHYAYMAVGRNKMADNTWDQYQRYYYRDVVRPPVIDLRTIRERVKPVTEAEMVYAIYGIDVREDNPQDR